MSYLRILVLGGLIFLPVAAMAEGNVNSNTWGLNLTRGVTPFSKEVYDLHMIVLWICVARRSSFWGYVLRYVRL